MKRNLVPKLYQEVDYLGPIHLKHLLLTKLIRKICSVIQEIYKAVVYFLTIVLNKVHFRRVNKAFFLILRA